MHTFYNIRREWKQVGFERIYAHRYGIRLLYRSKRKIGSLLPCCADTFLPFLLRTNADKLRSRAKRDGDSDTGNSSEVRSQYCTSESAVVGLLGVVH